MDADLYQDLTKRTEVYTQASYQFDSANSFGQNDRIRFLSLMYCTGKLNGEAGEVAEKVFKAFRDEGGHLTEDIIVALSKELGDVLWYVARIAGILDLSLSAVMEENIAKLTSRQERGTLDGSGDDR